LAFISEFNVQLLYLPGLKNVIADFLSRPNQTAAESVATTSAADPVDFEEMAAEQNRCQKSRVCWVAHLSNWLSARQALNAWLEMFPQEIFTQLFPLNSENHC
jgi:hypothetical protein